MWQQGVWRPSSQPLFIAEAAFSFWTEHSERNWLVSLLAALRVPPDDRKFIGRWLAASAADEYLRTAQQVVVHLQEKLVCALKGEDRYMSAMVSVLVLRLLWTKHVKHQLCTACIL